MIFIDSNIPMYLIGATHRHKIDARRRVEEAVAKGERLVTDAEVMQEILRRLGYKVQRRYQKMREEWRLGAVIICLDHTPIGDFAEFEGQGADKLAKRCGLVPEEAEKRSYLELYEDHVKANPGEPPDMVFK